MKKIVNVKINFAFTIFQRKGRTMYSQKMKNAVSSAQSCIDMCCGAQNVAMTSAEYLSAFVKYLEVLDPSGIDFLKSGFFAERRIKKYWQLFSEHYSKVTVIAEKLKQNRLIAENTLITLKSEQESFSSVYEEFLAEFAENADSEIMNQKTVAAGLKNILDNTVAEYGVLSERLKNITTTAADVFTNAVLIARVNYQINLTGDVISGGSGTVDISGFRENFKKLLNLCR